MNNRLTRKREEPKVNNPDNCPSDENPFIIGERVRLNGRYVSLKDAYDVMELHGDIVCVRTPHGCITKHYSKFKPDVPTSVIVDQFLTLITYGFDLNIFGATRRFGTDNRHKHEIRVFWKAKYGSVNLENANVHDGFPTPDRAMRDMINKCMKYYIGYYKPELS